MRLVAPAPATSSSSSATTSCMVASSAISSVHGRASSVMEDDTVFFLHQSNGRFGKSSGPSSLLSGFTFCVSDYFDDDAQVLKQYWENGNAEGRVYLSKSAATGSASGRLQKIVIYVFQMPHEFAAQEGSGIGQLEDSGGEEPFEYPPRGLRNDQGEPYFKHKNKVIKITKDMVDKIFDFPGGTVPFVFSSDDPQVKSEVSELRSNVDYSLPRITHIKNEDFQYLALVDRNYESKKAFGFLPLRDISQTPYANVGPVNNAPVNPPEFLSVPHVECSNSNALGIF
ncbi:hypothetical protein ZWY2020_038033 [Hordeum vulgare]|nr:hypothetical protein ZWY2020_038033 [Hordeum vulgare]